MKIRALLFALFALFAGVETASAAALDTSQLADITASLNTATEWLNGPLMGAIVGIVVASIAIAIIKFVGRKSKPSG